MKQKEIDALIALGNACAEDDMVSAGTIATDSLRKADEIAADNALSEFFNWRALEAQEAVVGIGFAFAAAGVDIAA